MPLCGCRRSGGACFDICGPVTATGGRFLDNTAMANGGGLRSVKTSTSFDAALLTTP